MVQRPGGMTSTDYHRFRSPGAAPMAAAVPPCAAAAVAAVAAAVAAAAAASEAAAVAVAAGQCHRDRGQQRTLFRCRRSQTRNGPSAPTVDSVPSSRCTHCTGHLLGRDHLLGNNINSPPVDHQHLMLPPHLLPLAMWCGWAGSEARWVVNASRCRTSGRRARRPWIRVVGVAWYMTDAEWSVVSSEWWGVSSE